MEPGFPSSREADEVFEAHYGKLSRTVLEGRGRVAASDYSAWAEVYEP